MSAPVLLNEIEDFIGRTKMSETAFGKRAVNDGKLVSNMRHGRRLWPETVEKVRSFMRQHQAVVQ